MEVPLMKKLLSLFFAVLLVSCNGGGGGGGSSSISPTPAPTPSSKNLVWETPQYFTDNTPLLPSRDLQGFEIYIKQDPSFGLADNPIATASPLDTTYNIANVFPPLWKGVTYYVSLRAVTVEGMKSDFSLPVSFSP
jgi:hypothetical protein